MAALLGTGIAPSGAIGTELSAITRRAYIPAMPVQLYNATPALSAALANFQTASGGVSSVTVAVQGLALTTGQFTGYDGSFAQPAEQQGIFEADFNLKCCIVPIPFLGMEGILQQGAAIIPKIEAKMNDSGNQLAQTLNTQFWTNATNATINLDGIPLIAATTGIYGNINRTTNTWWQGKARTASATAPTRSTVLEDIISASKANFGELPNIGFMAPGTWAKLAEDFVAQESYMVSPDLSFDENAGGARAAFTALKVAGVPIFMDVSSPENQLVLMNTRYTSFYIHESAAFTFTGFASTLPNAQLGYIGAVVVVLEFLSVKPISVCLVTGYSSIVSGL